MSWPKTSHKTPTSVSQRWMPLSFEPLKTVGNHDVASESCHLAACLSYGSPANIDDGGNWIEQLSKTCTP